MIEAYFAKLESKLKDFPIVVSHKWLRYKISDAEGSFRIRGSLINGDTFELAEFIILNATSEIEVIAYSYHWQNAANQLVMRWDNAKHHTDVRTFPHHVHIGVEDNIQESEGMSVDLFLRYLEQIAVSTKWKNER